MGVNICKSLTSSSAMDYEVVILIIIIIHSPHHCPHHHPPPLLDLPDCPHHWCWLQLQLAYPK